MGQKFLIDSNILIDYLGNKIPEKGALFIDSVLPTISVISRIEILGWFNASEEQIGKLKIFLSNVSVLLLEEDIILKTIEIRQKYRIKTPDAIIASTAIVNNLVLISRNTKDFKIINELKIIDPWEI
jgi:predicted nucleic acid-binding protein